MELGNGPAGGAIFIGEKGKITIDRGKCHVRPARDRQGADQAGRDPPLQERQPHAELARLHQDSRKAAVADVEIGHRSATVCHLGNIARWVGRKLRWDPVKEIFVGDDEANAYLDRKRRKPYELPETV